MKKLLAFLFLFATPVLAIDKPIPCEGANCKLKFETRDGSNVKVSAGNVNGTGAWTLGKTSYTADTWHSVYGTSGLFFDLENGASGIGANLYFDSIRNFNRYSTAHTGGALIFNKNTGTNPAISIKVNNPGDSAVTPAIDAIQITGKGEVKVQNATSTSLFSINAMVLFRVNTSGGGGSTCTTACQTEPSTLNTSSGVCVIAWDSSGTPSTCGANQVSGICMCGGLY